MLKNRKYPEEVFARWETQSTIALFSIAEAQNATLAH